MTKVEVWEKAVPTPRPKNRAGLLAGQLEHAGHAAGIGDQEALGVHRQDFRAGRAHIQGGVHEQLGAVGGRHPQVQNPDHRPAACSSQARQTPGQRAVHPEARRQRIQIDVLGGIRR